MRTVKKTFYKWTENSKTGKGKMAHVVEDRYILDDQDRIEIVGEILKGNTTVEEVREKYKLSSTVSIYSWIGKFISQTKSLSLQEETSIDNDMANKSKDDQIKELKAALKKAQKEAELEKLRAHAYDKMIDLAEERFNIPIRKKSGTKQ